MSRGADWVVRATGPFRSPAYLLTRSALSPWACTRVRAPRELASICGPMSPSRSVTTTSGRMPMARRRPTEDPDAMRAPSVPSLLMSSSSPGELPKTVQDSLTRDPASSSETRSSLRVTESRTLTQASSS